MKYFSKGVIFASAIGSLNFFLDTFSSLCALSEVFLKVK